MAWKELNRFQKEVIVWVVIIAMALIISAFDFPRLIGPVALVTIIILVIVNWTFVITGPTAADEQARWEREHTPRSPSDE